VIHRDIKPRNITYDLQKQRAVLIDYDIALYFGPSEDDPEGKPPTGEVGTRGYKAPELDAVTPYDTFADIWSLGISLAEIVIFFSFLFPLSSDISIKVADKIHSHKRFWESRCTPLLHARDLQWNTERACLFLSQCECLFHSLFSPSSIDP